LPRRVFLGTMASGHHLDRLAPERAELAQHLVAHHRLEVVAPRMREHRDAARGANPRDRILEACPAMRNISRLSLSQVLVERGLRVAHVPFAREMTREMRAAEPRLLTRERERALERPRYPERVERRRDPLRAPEPTVADRGGARRA